MYDKPKVTIDLEEYQDLIAKTAERERSDEAKLLNIHKFVISVIIVGQTGFGDSRLTPSDFNYLKSEIRKQGFEFWVDKPMGMQLLPEHIRVEPIKK